MDPVPICSCPRTFRSPEIVEVPVFVTEKLVSVVVPRYELLVTVRADVEALPLKILRADHAFAVYVLGIVVDE